MITDQSSVMDSPGSGQTTLAGVKPVEVSQDTSNNNSNLIEIGQFRLSGLFVC